MVNELKPCPLCGKQPNSRWYSASICGEDDSGYWGIDCCYVHVHADEESYALTSWNTRADTARLSELEAEVARLRSSLMDATANLAGCVSAYATYSCRHRSAGRGRADPFFTTRLMDFRRAEERARAALEAQS